MAAHGLSGAELVTEDRQIGLPQDESPGTPGAAPRGDVGEVPARPAHARFNQGHAKTEGLGASVNPQGGAPSFPQPPSFTQLPPHWATAIDPATGGRGHATSLCGPQLPPELRKLHAALEKVPLPLPDADSPPSPPLPAPEPSLDQTWVKLCEEGTWRAFYYNVVSQARQWEVPLGYQVCGLSALLVSPFCDFHLPAQEENKATCRVEDEHAMSIQPRLPPPCERDVRMLRHYFDPSTLPGNREDAKRKKEAMGKDRDWHQRKERKTLEKQRKALEWLRKE
ncbi:hypothetical protein NSK_008745 [Nannochloropsis salina CCMP1776]|uniref:WW domain-containing protein n=1 Tax=Nannochloropsis salina CCMP1776 TaxID=1027361 RepID=A0A4D9CT98_9STRA|nr:hypothetical protein NSK_008745 [Nannochloropsis salina CCMP1776]|eukprot:TFJ79938.1 hypothetical protein NSK_008745 [Nannochloropsis salina CCMP1776]